LCRNLRLRTTTAWQPRTPACGAARGRGRQPAGPAGRRLARVKARTSAGCMSPARTPAGGTAGGRARRGASRYCGGPDGVLWRCMAMYERTAGKGNGIPREDRLPRPVASVLSALILDSEAAVPDDPGSVALPGEADAGAAGAAPSGRFDFDLA